MLFLRHLIFASLKFCEFFEIREINVSRKFHVIRYATVYICVLSHSGNIFYMKVLQSTCSVHLFYYFFYLLLECVCQTLSIFISRPAVYCHWFLSRHAQKSWTCLGMCSPNGNEVFSCVFKLAEIKLFYQLLKDLEVLMKNVSTYFVLHFDQLHLTFLMQWFRRLAIHKNSAVDKTRKWWGKKGHCNFQHQGWIQTLESGGGGWVCFAYPASFSSLIFFHPK